MGNNAKVVDTGLKLIFVFGGPGTKKGQLVDNMSNVYGFEVINLENVILEELAKKIEDRDPSRTVIDIQQLLKGEQELLRLDTVLKMLVRKLNNVDKNKFCIVDFMPNLKWMLNNPTFIKECTNEMRVFEEKYPISFVIHFVMPKEKVLNKLDVDATPSSTTAAKPEASKQTDEMDSSRTQKRVLLFENSIKHFMDYFHKKDKVVTIDVSCGYAEAIWNKLCEFFSDFNLQSRKTLETVIVFGFDQEELDEINIGQYCLTVITLRDMAFDPHASVEILLEQICRYVDSCEPSRRVFAVDGTGTSLSRELVKKKTKKAIQFTESGEKCRLSRYCSVNLTTKGDPVDLQAIASLENEVCLFSTKVSPDLCKWIAMTMVDCRRKS